MNKINQITISYNGDIVIFGKFKGKTKQWVLTQKEMIKMLNDNK